MAVIIERVLVNKVYSVAYLAQSGFATQDKVVKVTKGFPIAQTAFIKLLAG